MRRLLKYLGCVTLAVMLAACRTQPRAVVIPAPSPNLAGIAADSPAFLCPADARLYIQVDQMSRWRAGRQDDPLMEQFWKSIEGIRPPGLWAMAAKNLGIGDGEFADRYFGDSFAVIASGSGGKPPFVLLSRVKAADLKALPAAMRMTPGTSAGPGAEFRTFQSDNPPLLAAICEGNPKGCGWLLMAAKPNEAYFKEILAFVAARLSEKPGAAASGAGGRVLPQDADFQSMLAKLPARHDLLLYTVDSKQKGRHVASLALDGRRMTAQYVGRIGKISELYRQFAHGPGVDFGPLPASAITAVTVNLVKKDDTGLALLNLFVFPKSIERDVLPKIDAPILVFLGQVDGAKLKPDPGIRVPAMGVAVRMKDASVAADLDRIVGGLHFFSSVGELDIIGGVLGGKTVRRNGLTYRVTDFGEALVKKIKDPETRRMFQLPDAAALTKLTYGPVGPWYLVCSQEALFLECAEAHAREEKRLSRSPAFKTIPFEAKEGLMLSAMTRAPELAALTKDVSDYWAKMEAKAARGGGANARAPGDGAGERIREPMEWIADAIKRRDSFYVQIWRDKDGDLAGRLSVIEPAAQTRPAR